MADFLMPSLGADMEAGTLVVWRKRPGDSIARGEILAEVETDKGLIEIECFTSGTIGALLVAPGTKVPVGTPLASIQEVGQPVTPPAPAATAAPPPSGPPSALAPGFAGTEPGPSEAPGAGQRVRATPAARRRMREVGLTPGALGDERVITPADLPAGRAHEPEVPAMVASTHAPPAVPVSRLRISPFARRLAAELGVALDGLTGTGPDAAIVAHDVRRAVQDRPAVAESERSPEARMRGAIASLVARSKREIPHFYLLHTVDLSETLAWLHAQNERRSMEERILLGALFVRAVAKAVKKVPELNAHFVDGAGAPLEDVHVGVAVALRGGGLVAPALRHADRLAFDDLNRSFKDLVQRARSGQLKSSEMAGATITITSLGERGVESVLPVIVPPQVAMVGFGTPIERPLVVAGAVVARPGVSMALAADHRVSDGHRGALFLTAIQSILQEPPT